jgi:hypothetical protein
MPPAEILRLDNRHAHATSKPGTKAGAGNAAADNQDINIIHRDGWLRFGKA